MADILIYSDNVDLAAELCGFSAGGDECISALTFDAGASQKLASCGAANILQAQCAEDALPESYAKSIAALIRERGFGLAIIGATPRGRDLAARIAGYLDCGFGSDVSNLIYDGCTATYTRLNYGGNVVSHESIEGVGVVTVGKGAFEKKSAAEAPVGAIELEVDKRAKLINRAPIVTEGVDIATADRVVGIGMGLSSKQEVELAEDLASAMGGTVACSRGIAEERGWLPVERYIGISGKSITPNVYLTLGISGQVQHLYGVRDAKIIAAVDKNENAPITNNADYYIVGDLAEYAPLITGALKSL